jgi:hypothetical protein
METVRGSRMTAIARSRRTLIGATALVAMTGGVGTYAAVASKSSPATNPGQQVALAPPGPERILRAYGATAADATYLFTLANGDTVGLVTATGAKCLVRSRGGAIAGEECAGDPGIVSGQGISITDECGAGSDQRMEITGLAPEGAAAVRLTISDGTAQTTPVVDGAFKFDDTNPGSGDPYPTGVDWVDNGTTVGSARLPVVGDQFCEPAD